MITGVASRMEAGGKDTSVAATMAMSFGEDPARMWMNAGKDIAIGDAVETPKGASNALAHQDSTCHLTSKSALMKMSVADPESA